MPPNKIVWEAITQQQADMQIAIAQDLGLSVETDLIPNFEVGKVAIESREKLSDPAIRKQATSNGAYISSLYKVVGTYSATLRKANKRLSRQILLRSS